MMEEFTREEVVKLALDAGLGRHDVMKDVSKYERLFRLVVRAVREKDDELDMDGRC